MATTNHTNQFKEVRTPSGKVAFEAWCAVWANDGNHVVIASPSLESLRKEWEKITNLVLAEKHTNHVYIVRVEK